MITNEGNNAIGRTLADFLGTHIAVGLSNEVPQGTDRSLKFEVHRVPVRVRSYDPTTNKVVYAATIPDSLELYIAEVALISSPESTAMGGIISTFDPGFESWTGGSQTSSNVRVGSYGLNIAAATATASMGNRTALEGSSLTDEIQVAYFGAGGTVEVRLGNSSTDYYKFTFPSNAGYNVASVPVASLVKTGSPDLAGVTELTVIHSGTGSVIMDAIRVNSLNDASSLIIRESIASPQRKLAGVPMDVEVSMKVNI